MSRQRPIIGQLLSDGCRTHREGGNQLHGNPQAEHAALTRLAFGAVKRPPSFSASPALMLNPSPVPPNRRVSELLA